ncbi:hypothetical protein K438DRAFT_448860 [Mycena galopus ATCC 62051]|nr:hypothetical protein K438DRAFT_448860 [Mycena galopus ATCC 62051]
MYKMYVMPMSRQKPRIRLSYHPNNPRNASRAKTQSVCSLGKVLPANSPMSPARHPQVQDLRSVSHEVAHRPDKRHRKVRKMTYSMHLMCQNHSGMKILCWRLLRAWD